MQLMLTKQHILPTMGLNHTMEASEEVSMLYQDSMEQEAMVCFMEEDNMQVCQLEGQDSGH
jgi:hypothetical protein